MSTGEDEPSSGLNGRLRPRKSNASPKTTPIMQKPETKQLNEKPKRTSTPSKVSPTKPDDLSNKTAVSPVSQVLCSFCDKTFGSRQAVAKHVKRVHSSTSKHDFSIQCLYCNHSETEANDIIRHMIDSHPNQYFACLNCQSRFSSTSELAEHKLNVCEKQKPHYRNKLRQKSPKKNKSHKIDGRHGFRQDSKEFSENHGFNGIVISCELKPSHVHEADIEDNIPTNLILPPSKSLANTPVIEKNAVIVLDDLQWNKRIPTNFNFHNTDADQILSRLGVVHRGPRTSEPNRRDWLKIIDETNQKFERCFDTSFYSKVASNVQENLAKFLDGSCNFNPDPDNTIKTRKLKNSVAINTAEGFPILLAFEQYSRNVFEGYMPRSIAPKHKWKWDNLEHDKTISPEQIKRDSHANNCIITLVSSLDIWTQLCMRQKFEDKFKTVPIEKKAEKQNIIGKELKEILEKRELPTPSSQVVRYVSPSVTRRDDLEFPASLGLAPATPNHDIKPAVLSGEWVRPRCYVCCACGFQARDSRALSSHITTQHPNAQIQHYEIVGERLLNSDISKHLYVPPSQVNNNRTRPLRGFRECTKCKKSISLEDLHQHMLDCAGDTPTVRRKCRARPFGVRKRRTRLPDNTIRKKIRKDIRTRDRHRKTLMRPRQKNRSDVGDAETIRKMLADLPAKRHRVLVNPLNSNLRPRRKFDKQRNKLKMKKNITDDVNKKSQGSVQSSSLIVGIEKLKVANQKEADSKMTKNNTNQAFIRQNSTSKRNSPLNTNRTLRLRESKGTSDQGSGGKKCADSGNSSGSTRSGSGGSGEAPFNTRENGNQSRNSNGHDNQQPGCSRQNDNNHESSGQPPNVPLKHSIARLTANTGTHDKSVQFHHLFLVQQECNNIPQHVPTRQKILFENEAVLTKLDKPPLNNNHGGTMDPMAQKSKSNKPRKGLNDCIAMLKNKLVEPSSQDQVPLQCDIESPSTSNALAKNDKPPNQTREKSKVTHEIAIQCADLDSDEPLAQALMKERRARQRQQALANIARQAERDGNVQSTSQEPQEGQIAMQSADRDSDEPLAQALMKERRASQRQQALANIAKPAERDVNVQSTSQERQEGQIAIQCADRDSDEPLAQALMKERRASQRQQALANIAKPAERDGNVQSTSQERQEGQIAIQCADLESDEPLAQALMKERRASQRQQALANIAKPAERDGNVQYTSQERQEGQIAMQCADLDSDEPLAQALMKERRANQRQQALANIARQAERDGNVQSTSQERQEGQIAIQCADLDSDEPLAQALMKERRASQRQQALANIARQAERDGNVQSTSHERREGQIAIQSADRDSDEPLAQALMKERRASQRQQALANIARQAERDGNVQSTSQERQEGQIAMQCADLDSDEPLAQALMKERRASQRQQALANIARQAERDGNVQSTSHERREGQIAMQCADLDSDEPLAQASMKERRASQRQQALANIARQAERDGNVQSTPQERQNGQVEKSPKKDKAKSKTPVTDAPKIEIAAQSNSKTRQNNNCTLEKDKEKIEVLRAENYVTSSVPLKGGNDCQQKQSKSPKDKEKVQREESNNSAVVSVGNVCQNIYNVNNRDTETNKPHVIPESPEWPAQNTLPKKKRNLKGHQENLRNEKAPSPKGKPTVEKKEKVTKETQKKNKGIGKKLSNTENKKVSNLKTIVPEKSILQETIASHAAVETKKIYPKRNKTKLESVSLVTAEVLGVSAEKELLKDNENFKKAIDIPIVIAQVTKDDLRNPKKTPSSEPQKNIPNKQKSDDVIPRTHDKKKSVPKLQKSENLPPEITKTDSIKSIEKEKGTNIGIHSQKSDECHKNLVPVIAVASNSTTKQQASFVELNTENRTPNEDDTSVYSLKQIPQNLSIQDSCEDLSMKEQTELRPDIPPAHCNVHMDSIIPIPLDLSGKISSTQSDSPAPYPISNYDDTYETLDLSNKNRNRDSTFNRVFIDEEVVDLRVRYPSHMHYESDLSMQSMPEEATDLSMTNEQLPKDLSLKSKNLSSSRMCAIQGADYSNIACNRSNYDSCSTSKTYDENSCLDFSFKETALINYPTDLSGKRENRVEPLVSTSSHMENRGTIESNSMDVSATANNSNTLDYNNSRMNTYGAYNKLAADGMINHSDRTYINPNPIISSEHIPKDSYEPDNLLKRKTYIEPEVLITAQELTKDYYLPTRTINASSGIVISESNEQLTNTEENFTFTTKMPLCISESIKTSIPVYNLSNRVIVTSHKKYESTTPVYTHANACISISKVETNNSDSLTNSLMSIPGNTITNTTSVYTLAGTTTGPINYALECNPISIDIQSQSLKSGVNDVMESPYQNTDKSAEVIVIEDKLQCKTERKQENLDQDPDIAKKIALLPKELVEILGTMPVDHRKQLLDVLPQYVSTATKSTTQSSNIDQSYSQNSMTLKSSLSPDLNKTDHSNLDATVGKRQQLHVPITPPSTLPAPSSQLSPTSISSSFLLTPPTPNIVRQTINVQRDLNTADCESSKNMNTNIIDLTEDDNSQTMPDAEVHTTTEITNVQTFTSRNDIQSIPPKSNVTKTNNDKTASLRAVRIKTQSERQRSIFPDIKVRKDSSEVPVTPLKHIETRDKVDTKGLKIQQGEISSSQCINKNIECEISSSVSLNTEHEVKSDEYLKAGEKEIIQPNMIVETSCEVGKNQILERVPVYKRYDVCSTTLDKSNYSDDSKDKVQVSTLSPPIQSNNIISNNNNFVLKPKKDSDNISSKVKGVSTEQITKSSDDDSSDDDVSLAAIVKQRNRDKLDLKINKHPTDVITNSNSVTSSVSSAEIKTNTSGASKTDVPISGESELKVLKNTYTDTVITEVKNKKKSRKTRRSNNSSVLNSFQHTADSDSDINKENTKILLSQNTKNKEDIIKQTHNELESGCVSSSNSDKEIIRINASHSDDTQNKIHEGQDFPKKHMPENDITQVDSSLDQLNKKKLLERKADVQTSTGNIYHTSSQETTKSDIIGLQKSLNTKMVCKKVEIKEPSTDNMNKITIENGPLKLSESGTESTTESLKQQQNTITPLRRSRRGKSLFIDNNVVNAEESSVSVDIISEQKMPLTKKQLIFSKLLLDEEHNVPPVSNNNCEKLDNQATTEHTSIISPNVEQHHVVQNFVSDSEIEQETSDSLAKTNKRKKSVQVKKKNKKKKIQQECSTLTEHKNQLKDDNITTSKNDQKLVVQKLIETLKDDIELSKEKHNSEESETPDIKDSLSQKTKTFIDNTLDATLNESKELQNKNSLVEKRKPDVASEIDSAMTFLPKKSKVNDTNKEKDEEIPKSQEDIQSKKVLINLDPKIADNKVKTRTTCYNKPIAAKRPRSKSVFVNSSDYYDPYDIDLEEMNETPESINRKVPLRKPTKTRKTPAANLPTKSDVKNKSLSESCDAVPSTSKSVTEVEKTQNKEEGKENLQVLKKTLIDTKENISDSDDSSKSDVPLQKYVEEKEKKMLDNIEKLNVSKRVDNIKDSSTTTNSKTKKKLKRSNVLNNKTEEIKNQAAENEAQLRSEQFMESFGFFSERKPRKSNLLASKKISETLHIIANETDDVYFGLKERSNKKISEKRHVDEEKRKGNSNSKETKQDKKAAKRGRKKKNSTFVECSYCQLCKKEFRRSDNFLRHQMSVGHVSKLSEIELKVKVHVPEEQPNYLVAFKVQLDRVKMLHEKIAKRKMLSLPTYDIIIPNLEEMLADAKRSVREKQIYNRGLSRDEALFIDCCELLKGSHNKNVRKVEKVRHCSSVNCTQSLNNQLDWFSKSIDDKTDLKNDGDVDSITARNILESDEVRNLEKDLISGLQEAAKATKRNIATFNFDNLRELIPDNIIKLATSGLVNANYGKIEKTQKSCQPKTAPKRSPEYKQKMNQRSPEYKEKMYPDINIESIDMFEDKFDKIKRKCRSQAAAASKQPQATPEANASYKIRKNKMKGKKKIRNHQNTVLTKAALKGFDGIKVSIVTTEINMSGIMSSAKKSSKKKKKNQTKRKRERKSSEVSSKTYDSKQDDPPQKKLDIYEFMDTDDAEVFDFRPSTIMERFKSISNKEIPSTSKNIAKYDEAEVSSDSASDGDDFVYMSDDYVCSDDETENSVISCEIKSIADQKKSPHKRKDTTEKSAVMGKIFKHNALRTEKKISKSNDIELPKANLDQLFDSLLEEKPQSSKPNETITSKSNEISTQRYLKPPSPKQANKSDNDHEYDMDTPEYDDDSFYRDAVKDDDIEMQASKVARRSTSFNKIRRSTTPTKRPSLYAIPPTEVSDAIAAGNKYKDSLGSFYSERDKFDTFLKKKEMIASPESMDESNSDDASYNRRKSTEKSRDSRKMKPVKSHDRGRRVSFDCNSESLDATNMSDDAGVARQRVRRKCTVGKQNILAETWSSESEPDGMPPRPNSAESVVGTNRRRKGRKREGHSAKKLKLTKRTEVDRASKGESGEYESGARAGGFARPGPSLSAQGPVRKGRAGASYSPWSEGEEEQEHVQQHGWIVGDSHKKLVTMLAHAKGRKRDDKRPLLE